MPKQKVKKYIRGFRKTYHFIIRQRERGLNDDLVKAVLGRLEKRVLYSASIIVTPKVMVQLANEGLIEHRVAFRQNLIIRVHRKVLITLYLTENLRATVKNLPPFERIFIR